MSGSNALADVFNNANRPTVAPGNLLEYGSQAGDVAAKINANRLFQANALRGQLIGQATDANGVFDGAGFNRLAAGAGPGYAPAAAAGLDQSTRIGGEQQTQALKNLTVQSTALDSLGPNATYQQVHDKVSEGVKAGWLQTTGANSVLLGMPQGDDPQSRATRSHILQTIGDQVRSATERLQSQYGVKTTQTGPGGMTTGISTDQRTGAVSSPPQPGAPQGPDPGTLSGVSTITDSQGTPHTDSLYGHIANGRVTPMGTPAPGYSVAPAAAGGAPRAPVKDYTGVPNPLLGGLPNPQEAAQPAAPSGPRSGGTTGPAPGVVEGQRKIAEDSAGAFKEISDQGVGAQSRGAVLDNMLSDTSQFSTGPGADIIARVRAVANRLGYNVNTEGLSAAESFKKLAAALNANQGSDARLSVSEASNPHADLSPAGIDLMIRQLRGNEDYTQARARLAADYPDRKDKIGFEAKVGAQLDPRTFQYDRMTPAQKSTFFKSIDDKDKFIKAHDAAATLLGSR